MGFNYRARIFNYRARIFNYRARIFHLDSKGCIPDTASKVLLQSVGPGRRLNIVKGSATQAGGAAVVCLSNLYTVRGGSSCKLLM